jgi:hypothetical protein
MQRPAGVDKEAWKEYLAKATEVIDQWSKELNPIGIHAMSDAINYLVRNQYFGEGNKNFPWGISNEKRSDSL